MARPTPAEVEAALVAVPGEPFRIAERSPQAKPCFEDKADALASLDDDAKAIDELQDRLFAEGARALLIVLQGSDTSGKSSTINAVFGATGPLGVQVTPFGRPTPEELAHDFLWRIEKATPRKGYIGIFDRSHYEDVLVARVRELAPPEEIERRYGQINEFERRLTECGVTLLKFFLHISHEEQGARLRARRDDPNKRWKFNPSDLDDRKYWTQYMAAYEIAVQRCSTPHAPWFVVPSDSRSRRNAMVARIVRGALERMDPKPRDPGWRMEDHPI